jgi:hypothetical protein
MEFMTQNWFSYLTSAIIFISPFLLKKNQSPSSIVSLTATFGIFGTFLGIFAGLVAFQVTDIEGSVPRLLEGLKTAFLTSIAGMGAGMLIKVWPRFYGITISEAESKRGEDAMIAILDEIKQLNSKQIDNQSVLLQNIEKALCGDGDTTVLTQLQKLRTSFSDKQDELVKEFRLFAKTMAENNSSALIEALSQVMRDFNAKINEQFGDNFKQLNQAVEKILIWQEKYKEEVEQMIIAFDKSLQGIEASEQNLASINKHADNFTVIATNLQSVISDLEEQKNEVQARLQDFAEVAKEAKTALPIIKDEVNKLTREFTSTVSAALAEISVSITSVKETVSKQSGALTESQQILNRNLDTMMKENAERIAKQVAELDKALGEELTKSLNTMSGQLASLSLKFVQDYTPLTERLKEVVQISKQIPN